MASEVLKGDIFKMPRSRREASAVTETRGDVIPTAAASPQGSHTSEHVSVPCTSTCTDNTTITRCTAANIAFNDGSVGATGSLSAALLTQQLPPISNFSGEELDNEPFEDWILI